MKEEAPIPPESRERTPLDSVETLADMLLDQEKLATLPEDEGSLLRIDSEITAVFRDKKTQLKRMTSEERGEVWDMAEHVRSYLNGLLNQGELSATKYVFINSLCIQFYDLREMAAQIEEQVQKNIQ